MNSATIKRNRELLFQHFSEITYKEVLSHFNTTIEELGNVLLRRRKLAVLKGLYENNRSTGATESICWYCRHSTNRYGECSWSANLEPREDWDENSYEETENGIRVRYCPGFDVGEELAWDRKMAEMIFADAFGDKDGFLSRRYFNRMDEDLFDQWVEIYNGILEMAGLPLITVREDIPEDPDEETVDNL